MYNTIQYKRINFPTGAIFNGFPWKETMDNLLGMKPPETNRPKIKPPADESPIG